MEKKDRIVNGTEENLHKTYSVNNPKLPLVVVIGSGSWRMKITICFVHMFMQKLENFLIVNKCSQKEKCFCNRDDFYGCL